MNKSVKVLILLPGYHFAGHPEHMNEGKLSMRVRLESLSKLRDNKNIRICFILLMRKPRDLATKPKW